MLELVLTAEDRVQGGKPQQRTPQQRAQKFTALLTSNKFHKGLMACCLEVVIASYKWVHAYMHHTMVVVVEML